MEKFYCNSCDKFVELIDGKCPRCGTNWAEIISNAVSNDSAYNYIDSTETDKNSSSKTNYVETYETSNTNDIEDTYLFFLDWALVVKIFFFVLAGIVALMAFIWSGDTEGSSFMLLIPSAILVLCGIILEKSFKWKAYMLQTNYDISTKKK